MLTFTVSIYSASEPDERNIAQKLFGAIKEEHEKLESEMSRQGSSIPVQVVVGETRHKPTPSGMTDSRPDAVMDGPMYDMEGKQAAARRSARWDLIFEDQS